MANLYVPFAVEYLTKQGEWEIYVHTEDWDSVPTYLTLPSDPVRLRVNLDHPDSAPVKDMSLSEYNIQWHVGNSRVIKSPELNYFYRNAGNKNINVYIARGDGLVISRGTDSGKQLPIKIQSRNFLGTDVSVSVDGEEDVDWRSIRDEDGEKLADIVYTRSGRPTAPLQIYTQHTWQLFDETPDKYGVWLYADNAGKRRPSPHITGNDCAPLKTPSYYDNKYAQFQKTWRFCTDAQLKNPVDHVTITPVKLYARRDQATGEYSFCDESDTNAEFVGTSGVQPVYYVDDSMVNYLEVSGAYESYRLHFQMDTRGWPDYQSGIQMNTQSIKQSTDYVETPDHYQGPKTELNIDVSIPIATQLVFTSTGIQGHDIAANKFEQTDIPFVVSMADVDNNIIKHSEGLSGTGDMIPEKIVPNIPWTDIDIETVEKNVYYIGLSSSNNIHSSWFDMRQNQDLIDNKISTYSSFAGVLSCAQPVDDVRLVAALSSTHSGFVSGMSSSFNINPRAGKYKFFKHGEGIDYGGVVNSYILQENVNQHGRLESMLNAIFGQFQSIPETLGKTIYEKIDNFVANNSDIDLCNVTALNGLAREVDATISNFDMSYPGGVRRLVDIFSVGIQHIIGDRDKYQDDFDTLAFKNEDSSIRYGRNLGEKIDTKTYMVTAGEPLVAKELYGSQFKKIIPTYIPGEPTDPHYTTYQNMNGLSSYPLTSYADSWNWGLSYSTYNKFSDFYDFYQYKSNTTYPLTSFDQNRGMINWEDTEKLGFYEHVLTESMSSYDQWYGDTGIIQSSLEYSIRNGLEIL